MIIELSVPKEQDLASITQQKYHPDVLNILYDNRFHIKKKFGSVIGFYEIHHISITIIDPSNEMVVFSTTPSIEYHLITQDLWKHDLTVLSHAHRDDELIWWDMDNTNSFYSQIDNIKKQKNNYTLGMSLARKIDGFCIIYSFATKSREAALKSYYISNIERLYDIGDHCYKSIRDIYSAYVHYHTAPRIMDFEKFNTTVQSKPYLQLVVNNSF